MARVTRERLCEFFKVPLNTPILDEFPSGFLGGGRVEIVDHSQKKAKNRFIPEPWFSVSVNKIGGPHMWNCAVARQCTQQGKHVLIGTRVAYVRAKIDKKLAIMKVAHTGRALVVQNDKEQELRRPVLVYFYPLTPGRTAAGLAAGRGTQPPRGPKAASSPHVRNMDKSLESAKEQRAA